MIGTHLTTPSTLLALVAVEVGAHIIQQHLTAGAGMAAAAAGIRQFPITLWVHHLPFHQFKLAQAALGLRE